MIHVSHNVATFRNKMPWGDGRKCPEHEEYIPLNNSNKITNNYGICKLQMHGEKQTYPRLQTDDRLHHLST